jgi:hypothetical protein
MKWEPSENERGLECAIVKMALSAQEVELSPTDLPTMRRLTKTLQRYLRMSDIASGRKPCHRSEAESNRHGCKSALQGCYQPPS